MKWIIGIGTIALMLVTTGLVVFKLLQRIGGHPHRPHVEIDQLSQAVQSYKEGQIAYPPCIAENSAGRKERFMTHLAIAFPNSAYGTTEDSFDRLNAKIGNQWNYNFLKSDGSVGSLDLETLDPAEALVFWLGGFPTPIGDSPIDQKTKQPIETRRLFGLHRDSDDPFKRDTPRIEASDPLRYRTDPLFGFDVTRLADNDHDGWWEYASGRQGDELLPPYVYFDAETYFATTKDAKQLGTCFYPHDVALAKQWGTAIPYLSSSPAHFADGGWPTPKGFQIVCAGPDGVFGPHGSDNKLPASRLTTLEPLQSFWAGDGFQHPHETDRTELDNLTSLSSKSLGAAVD
jgi:hypothetical protein